jgi:hypothetical protein
MNDLGLEQADYRLGEGVVEAVANAADREHDPGLGEALGVADRQILHPAADLLRDKGRPATC